MARPKREDREFVYYLKDLRQRNGASKITDKLAVETEHYEQMHMDSLLYQQMEQGERA